MPMPSTVFSPRETQQPLDAGDDSFDRGLGIGGGRHHFLGSEFSVDVRQRHGDLKRPDIDSDDDAIVIEAQKCRPPAARQPSRGTFQDPVAFNELLDDQRNGAALQAGNAGEVGAGDRLLGTNQVEDGSAVDIADAFHAGGDLHSFFVDAAHVQSNGRAMVPGPVCRPPTEISVMFAGDTVNCTVLRSLGAQSDTLKAGERADCPGTRFFHI